MSVRAAAAAPSSGEAAPARLLPGDPAPRFRSPAISNPDYVFDTVAGRTILLCFPGSGAAAIARDSMAAVAARTDLFDDVRASFFMVSNDPADQAERRLVDRYPGYRTFWDFEGRIAGLYGALPKESGGDLGQLSPMWVVIDRQLRVVRTVAFAPDRSDIAEAIAAVEAQPHGDEQALAQAPVLLLPNVFDAGLCEELIAGYRAHGGEASGFMREEGGRTVLRSDPDHKKRRDWTLGDTALIARVQERVRRTIVPEIARIHYFHVTRMERYLVGCYTAEDGGHFRAHRDNTTSGTAHRRFAVSINLNADFDGGEVGFPEYGARGYKPPAGGALVFSCSLLHMVSRVTRGERFAFLPFLYDDAAAALRARNNAYLGEGLAPYRG